MNSIYAVVCSSSLLGAVSSSTFCLCYLCLPLYAADWVAYHISAPFCALLRLRGEFFPDWNTPPCIQQHRDIRIARRLQPGENVFINRIYRNNKPLIKCFINKPSYSCCCCCRRMYYHLGLVNESEPTPPSHITCSTKDTRRVATYIEMAEVNGSMAAAQYKYAR